MSEKNEPVANVESVMNVSYEERPEEIGNTKVDSFPTENTRDTEPTLYEKSIFSNLLSFFIFQISIFRPRLIIEEIFMYFVQRLNPKSDVHSNYQTFNFYFENTLKEFIKGTYSKEQPQWLDIYTETFDSNYPLIAKEFYHQGRICQIRFPKNSSSNYKSNATFSMAHPTPAKRLTLQIIQQLFPNSFKYHFDKKRKEITKNQTAESSRFANLEKGAIEKSSLHRVTTLGRPAWNITPKWTIKQDSIPEKIEVPTLTSTIVDTDLLWDFISDLQDTFAWKHSYMVANYLGFLIQPMIVHIGRTQMPAYIFTGSTSSGKNYTAEILPSKLYNNSIYSTVISKKLPETQYEWEVFLGSARNALYVVLDEIKNATDEQLKFVDSTITNSPISVRVLNSGIEQIENNLVIAATSVSKVLTDETEGRFVRFEFTEARNSQVEKFTNKWENKYPILLSTIYHLLNQVSIDTSLIPTIKGRRSGFKIVGYFVERVFGMKPDYSIRLNNSETDASILEDVCTIFESNPDKKYLTLTEISNYLIENKKSILDREIIWEKINQALDGTGNTITCTRFKLFGYPANNGKNYHIKASIIAKDTPNERKQITVTPTMSDPQEQIFNEQGFASERAMNLFNLPNTSLTSVQ